MTFVSVFSEKTVAQIACVQQMLIFLKDRNGKKRSLRVRIVCKLNAACMICTGRGKPTESIKLAKNDP